MAIENVNCNECGALIEVTSSIHFVTCARCSTPLVLRRTESSTYTERTAAQTEFIPTDLMGAVPVSAEGNLKRQAQDELSELQRQSELNRLENELNRLDLDWDDEKDDYMVAGRYGHRYIPTTVGSVFGGIAIAVFGAFWVIMAFGITTGFSWSIDGDRFGPPPIIQVGFPLFGLVFIVFGVGSSISAYDKASKYEQAHAAYLSKRRGLLEEINSVRGGGQP